ncbi:AbrB/MazE/SpoVT family DNA-binding domain-containing protein [bacterium]|nr:AbrB/MazE/SpoVT family DNA-binding domain-containing protein [bacterium]
MQTISTTRLSSKGQVVIPEEVRKRLRLETGTQFIVAAENDVVILKTIQTPSMKEFDSLIKQTRRQAREAGLKKSDVTDAIRRARGRK